VNGRRAKLVRKAVVKMLRKGDIFRTLYQQAKTVWKRRAPVVNSAIVMTRRERKERKVGTR
jgi:hypothetical protein